MMSIHPCMQSKPPHRVDFVHLHRFTLDGKMGRDLLIAVSDRPTS